MALRHPHLDLLLDVGIVTQVYYWGKKKSKIYYHRENIIPLQPSAGFCAELIAATTILLASR